MTGKYMILMNEEAARVLVTGREQDKGLAGIGWSIIGSFKTWREAYERARDIADERNYILEWYLEEETPAPSN